MRRIETPTDAAEGRCDGTPYFTTLASIDGVTIHFWMGAREPAPERLAELERIARGDRDIVGVTWSLGEPTGFERTQFNIVAPRQPGFIFGGYKP